MPAPPPRRVGFDAIRALRNTTGLGNYSRGVLRALREHDGRMTMDLYSPAAPVPEFCDFPREISAELHLPSDAVSGFGLRALGSKYWRTFRLGRVAARDGMRIYHGLTHEIPRDLPGTGIPSVVTFHDLIYRRHPELFPLVDRWSYRWRYDWSARHADAIVAVSARTRDHLLEDLGLDPARITVIPPPRHPAFAATTSPSERDAARSKYRLPGEYLLAVGTLEPRKNHAVLLAAIARRPATDRLPLVLIGRDGGGEARLRDAARSNGLDSLVHFRDNVASPDLPALMQGATLFLYPSMMEGFGMPIVEALSAGVPVIAASGGHLDDAGGPDSRYAAAGDPAAWATAITELLADGAARDRMRQHGIEYATRFDGAKVAAELLHVYDTVLAPK